MTGNPTGTKNRFPLSILLSADGERFDVGYTLRDADDLQERRYEGQYKSAGYSYPKSVLWGDHLYLAYGTNKEDAELTRVPVGDLNQRDVPGQVGRPEVHAPGGGSLRVSWPRPQDEGDSPVTGFVVTASARSGQSAQVTVGADADRATLTGLHPGRYQVRVVAENEYGPGPASAGSPWVIVTGRPF